VAHAMKPGTVFISSATMDPAVARDLAQRVEALGLHYLYAPISGGAAKAARGERTIMASGSKQAVDTARPGLDAMAAKG
ncbi:NAD(P)-binding domain-containing protein, partial [Rhizobium ruizarguesonis]